MRRRILRFALFAVVLGFVPSTPALAQEYWGKFQGTLDGTFVDEVPRPKFQLSKTFEFLDPNGLSWTVPKDAKVDGASIPQEFWSVIGGPFEGPYLKASVIHDYYCDTKQRTAHDTHRNFYYGMRANGVPKWTAKLMYWAVSTFGPDWKLLSRVVNEFSCNQAAGRTICASSPNISKQLVLSAAPNLADPAVLAIALSKFSAIAKTLKTSNGDVIDVGATGQVDASLESMDTNAAFYRDLLGSGRLEKHIDEIGILAEAHHGPLETVSAWKGNRIPSTDDLRNYRSYAVAGDKGGGFVVEHDDLELIVRNVDLEVLHAEIDFNEPM